SEPLAPSRNPAEERDPYRDDYTDSDNSGGFSLSSLLRKRTR
ncbi:MAG: cell division protein FtsZ, partial [Cardiobacterium sp.]